MSRKRVARLMREEGLTGVSRRRGTRTTRPEPGRRAAAALVERHFQAEAPNRLWVADIPSVASWAGLVCLAVGLDGYRRRIVGGAMADPLRTERVLEALNRAVRQRRPEEGIHHSDPGSQYISVAFAKRCRERGVRPSTGSAGECYDPAMAESFFVTVECERLDRCSFRTRTEAKRARFDFIEGGDNRHRRHCALGSLSPDDFEHVARRRATTDPVAQDEVPTRPRDRLPTPGIRENLPSPVIALQTNGGENHQLSTSPG